MSGFKDLKSATRRFINTRSWDVRRRNLDVAISLNSHLEQDQTFLDVGCGENMLLVRVSAKLAFGVDLNFPTAKHSKRDFVSGSIIELPFADDSFSFVSSVDVLEHLPVQARIEAIRELVRVAKNGIVVAFPFGRNSRAIDEHFYKELKKRGRPIPDWLDEHLENEYPGIEWVLEILEDAAKLKGSSITTKVAFSEDIRFTRILRWSAARSSILFVSINVALGICSYFVPKTVDLNTSYRATVTAIVTD